MTVRARVAGVLAVLVMASVATGSASAHAYLIKTVPAASGVLNGPPPSVALTYDKAVEGRETMAHRDLTHRRPSHPRAPVTREPPSARGPQRQWTRPQAGDPRRCDQHRTDCKHRPGGQVGGGRAAWDMDGRDTQRMAGSGGEVLNLDQACRGKPRTGGRSAARGRGDGLRAGRDEPEAVWHDHQQRPVVDQRELLTEKACVALWAAPQLTYGAQVSRRRDDRDPQGETPALCLLEQRRQLRLLTDRRTGILGKKQRLRHEHVRCGIAVGPRRAGRQQTESGEARDDQGPESSAQTIASAARRVPRR